MLKFFIWTTILISIVWVCPVIIIKMALSSVFFLLMLGMYLFERDQQR
jgi:hypothetical protein